MIRLATIRLASAVAVLVCLAGCLRGQTVDVYILTGQSNSLGTTGLEESAPNYEPGTDPADAQTQFFWSNVSASNTVYPPVLYGDSGGAISTMQMQQGDGGVNPFFWGPEFGFARTMFQNTSGNDVLIIKASRGGGGNGFWDEATFNSNNNSGHMWGQVRDQVDIALGLLTTAGTTFEVKGLIYMQGESNSSGQAAIADTRIKDLATSLKSHINSNYTDAAANMYTVITEIAASSSNSNRITTTDLQRTLAHHNPDFAFVTTSDLALKSDGIHFGRDAKLAYGNRIADAFNSRGWSEDENVVGGYNADPNPIAGIPDPGGLGFDFSGNGAGVTAEGVTDSGSRAWRLEDNSAGSNPGYFQDLHPIDFQRMFDSDWEFTVTAKVVSGGGLALWSVTQANDPGWGVGANGIMNGFQLDHVNGDELRVTLWQNQTSWDIGAGSADSFHTIRMAGYAGSTTYDLYIDGNLTASSLDLLTGNGSTAPEFQDALLFNSGSTGGTGREVYWSEVSLTAAPSTGGLPSKSAPEFSHYFPGDQIYDGANFLNGWSLFSGSGTFALSGTELSVVNSGGLMLDASDSTNGSSTWDNDLNGPDFVPYSAEIKFRANDLPNGYRMWMGFGTGRDFVDFYNDRITITQSGGGFVDIPFPFNDGQFHTVRFANDGNVSNNIFKMAHVWLDGIELTDPEGNPLTSGTDDERLLFGDYTSGSFGDNYDIDIAYIAYDTTGAFSPTLPVVVVPDSITIVNGTLSSGDFTSLAESDNVDLSIQRNTLDVQSRTTFTAKGVCPVSTPTELTFTLEGSVFARGNVTQNIDLYDYDADDWELVDTQNAARFGDSTVEVSPSGDPSRFVQPGTGCVEARVRFVGAVPRMKFASNTDQAIWTIE